MANNLILRLTKNELDEILPNITFGLDLNHFLLEDMEDAIVHNV